MSILAYGGVSTLAYGKLFTLAYGGLSTLAYGGLSTLSGGGLSTSSGGGLSALSSGGVSTLSGNDYRSNIPPWPVFLFEVERPGFQQAENLMRRHLPRLLWPENRATFSLCCPPTDGEEYDYAAAP